MLATLVSLLPTRFKWLRRLRYVLLMALMVRAWMMKQNRDPKPKRLDQEAIEERLEERRKNDPAGLTSL